MESEGEFFAAVLLQTYTWWREEQIDLGLDMGSAFPLVMHTDAASIVEHHAQYPFDPGDEDTSYVIVPLPSLFQREYQASGKVRSIADETRAAVLREAEAQGVSEIEVLLARFRVERAFLADFLRQALRDELAR